MKVYFLGPVNSYSHLAAKHILPQEELISVETFGQIVEKILTDENAVGVLPIENSITSDIHENIDALFRNNHVSIIAETYVKIALHVIGLEEATMQDITEVYSHPRALAQCTNFIKKHHLAVDETTSTSKAKDIIVEKNLKNLAAIGNSLLEEKGKTKILEKNIGNDAINMTRFVFVSEQQTINNTKNKTSIIFKVPHIPGSLAKILTKLAEIDLNLTKIESRPIPGTSWEYYFWVDVEKQNLDMEKVKQILDTETTEYRVLGTYQKGDVYQS